MQETPPQPKHLTLHDPVSGEDYVVHQVSPGDCWINPFSHASAHLRQQTSTPWKGETRARYFFTMTRTVEVYGGYVPSGMVYHHPCVVQFMDHSAGERDMALEVLYLRAVLSQQHQGVPGLRVPRYLEFSRKRRRLHMVMDWREKTLEQLLYMYHVCVPVAAALRLVQTVLRALHHLHTHPIRFKSGLKNAAGEDLSVELVAHCSVHPGNIIISDDCLETVWLSEPYLRQGKEVCTQRAPWWTLSSWPAHSPESMAAPNASARRYAYNTPAHDMYCLGLVIYQVLTGLRPYGRSPSEEERALALSMNVALDRTPIVDRELIVNKHARPLLVLMDACLSTDPADRPTAERALYYLANPNEPLRPGTSACSA